MSQVTASTLELNDFDTRYEALSENERWLVQLLAVSYEALSLPELSRCLSRLRVHGFGASSQYSAGKVRAIVAGLAARGLIVTDNQGVLCPRPLLEPLMDRVRGEKRLLKIARIVQSEVAPIKGWSGIQYRTYEQGLRDVWIAAYRLDVGAYHKTLRILRMEYPHLALETHPAVHLFRNALEPERFEALLYDVQVDIMHDLVRNILFDLTPDEAAFALLRPCAERGLRERHPSAAIVLNLYVEQLLLRGRLEEAEEFLATGDWLARPALQGWLHFLRGDNEAALRGFRLGLRQLRENSRNEKVYYTGPSGIFYLLALFRAGTGAAFSEAKDAVRAGIEWNGKKMGPVYASMNLIEEALENPRAEKGRLLLHLDDIERYRMTQPGDKNSLGDLFLALGRFVLRPSIGPRVAPALESLATRSRNAGMLWIETEATDLLARIRPEDTKVVNRAAQLRSANPTLPLAEVIRVITHWEWALEALVEMAGAESRKNASRPTERLAWFVKEEGGRVSICAKIQRIGKKGTWTKGRKVSTTTLAVDMEKSPVLTQEDRTVCSAVKRPQSPFRWSRHYGLYELDILQALEALAKHPLVFLEDAPGRPLEIVLSDPELIVTRTSTGVRLELHPAPIEGRNYVAHREEDYRLRVFRMSEKQLQMAEVLGERGVSVPSRAAPRALEAVAALASVVPVNSDLPGVGADIEEIEADATPRIQLSRYGEGLRVEIVVRPLASSGPSFPPGKGRSRVIADVDGVKRQARRDLTREQGLAAEITRRCPTLDRSAIGETATDEGWGDGAAVWLLPDPESCLECLDELQSLGEDIHLEWPKGDPIRIVQRASFEQLHLTIKQDRDWFQATGQLRVDESLVLDMRALLSALEERPGRFVPLGDDRFLALTRQLRKQLEQLSHFSQRSGKGIRFHTLAAPALEEIAANAGTLTTDEQWKSCLARYREAQALEPRAPSTFLAELRGYQVDGFQWLFRLACWGVGACLADDMGLGKTIQALALILTRAPEGPTLVVAPTSVCMNWEDETRRFAPTLRCIRFGAGDRRMMLEALGPFDLLVTSYSLLQIESELFSEVKWRTIVLDEAQAIKNLATKRSQAAINLQGDFKMITTGTPIENRLGELWNLFRFLNPGLLGSLNQFNTRYVTPIEKHDDKNARTRLKKLIRPFILRRTKQQVLEELPPRTEIAIQVELGADELALYEALRRRAVEEIEEGDGPEGQQQLKILAHLMKLRRACCNPRLVVPDSDLPSAKLTEFGNIIQELLENRHKTLVFSQFVGHLNILRAYLEEQKISYQYLVGATSPAERKKRIKAFQAGHGDVFLISLKAGGLGLNLTAADYVIHMDPWWNPAAEDQASDRAHRIGQTRPVTIYRLIARNTIEEKIVALHRHKRELADHLLEGTHQPGRLSSKELMELLLAENDGLSASPKQ